MKGGAYGDQVFDFQLNNGSPGGGHEPTPLAPAPHQSRENSFEQDPALDPAAFELQEDIQTRVERVQASCNPLCEAALPLLRTLAEVPASLDAPAAIVGLRTLLIREISLFQKVCDKANLPWTHVAAVRYALCTALDEAANRTHWGGGGVWAARSLLITFEGEVEGGEKFFLLIGRMATDPQEYANVLEVMYRILCLGFEGRYSVVIDGNRRLEQIRHRLLALVNGVRDTVSDELSPHWRGEALGPMRLKSGISVWMTIGVAALLIFALFAWYKSQLLYATSVLEAKILELGRAAIPIASVAKPPLRLSILLKNEIARGLVAVDEDAHSSNVVFSADSMFTSAQSRIRPELEPILAKVAQEITRVGGHVIVTGHTDGLPIHTSEYLDNQALSEKRAAFVADVLKSHGTTVNRIVSIGKGSTQPIASDATADGRARNRRVEILVLQ